MAIGLNAPGDRSSMAPAMRPHEPRHSSVPHVPRTGGGARVLGRLALIAIGIAAAPSAAQAAEGALDRARVHDSPDELHVELGFGEGVQVDADTRSAAFVVGAGYRVLDALELTLSTKGLDHGRGTSSASRSSANLELGARWLPFGRPRSGPRTTFVGRNVQLEAGGGLARTSLVPWTGVNPFAADETHFGLGFSAGVRWLPYVSSSFAAGLGAWYLGQLHDGSRLDAWMVSIVIELGS